MKKPEYLTGEAKTFLEWVGYGIENQINALLLEVQECHAFYSQPFTKDMIVRPNGKPTITKIFEDGSRKITSGWQPLFKGDLVWLNRHYVDHKTPDGKGQILVSNVGSIDDFIQEAKKAGIKLEWYD